MILRAAAALLAATAMATPANATARPGSGWTEAVVSVTDLEAVPAFLQKIGNWRETGSGPLDPTELAYYRVTSDGSTNGIGGAWRRLCAPQADVGCIRFVRFDGVTRRPIRPAARAWDTGGIYSLMVRTDDVDALYQAALAEPGWWAESPPIRFGFGTSDLRNVVIRGPHGIQFAAYERVSPAFTDFPVGRISQAFNSMRMVRDQPAAKAFYEKLGFGVCFDSDFEPLEPQWSNFSIPRNFTPIIRRKAAALQPVEAAWGRVEVMQIVGFEGHDHSAAAVPPNLGILSVRFPVTDSAAYRALLEERGIHASHVATKVTIGNLLADGSASVSIFAVRSPDGALTEFYAPSE